MDERQRSNLTWLAKRLRSAFTDAERTLCRHLRNRNINGVKFRRQYVIERYVVDFVSLDHKLIVELDGGQHLEQVNSDATRTKLLETRGFRVIRFWNHDVLTDPDTVLERILLELKKTPHPLKRGEEVNSASTFAEKYPSPPS